MGDSVLSAASLVVAGLVALAIASLVLDGALQVTTGRPGFLPFERLLRKRVPASDADCIRRGAAQLLQAIGLTVISGPQILLGLIASGNLTGAIAAPASAYPTAVRTAIFIVDIAALIFGLVCLVAAYNVSTTVRYVPTGDGVRSTSS